MELKPRNRYFALDALRFVLAFWVVIGHFRTFPLFGSETHQTGVVRWLARGFDTVVWGPPAVMAFFVISGFCIHYPNRSPGAFPVLMFYGRRYTRILVPVGVALLLMRMLFGAVDVWGASSILWKGTLWSLLCEEIY